jgi:transposase
MKRAKRSLKQKPSFLSKAPSQGPICPAARMPVVHPHAAGIDVGASEHYVCVPSDAVPAGESPVRSFGVFTQDLDRLVDWLREAKVQTVAMESTGVYWVVLCGKLEAAGIEVVLANARHLRQVPGRKTDVKDCQWLQQLHSYGLLNGSFRPSEDICPLRALMRHRSNLVLQKGQQVQHMQRAFQQMNVLLHRVVSDVDGDTGLRIVDAILAGEREAKVLVQLRDYRIKRSTEAEMEAALTGDWRAEQLLVLRQAREAHQFFERQIRACDEAVVEQLKVLPTAPPPGPPPEGAESAPSPSPASPSPSVQSQKAKGQRKRRKVGGNEPATDLMPELIRICGVDLSAVRGLNMLGILILLSEVGMDMSCWRSEKAFSAWLGLAPGNKISGGRILSSRTPYVVSRVATLLRTLAVVIGRTDTWLGSFHRRMRARLGPAAAATATARKLACIIYHLLKHKEPYQDVNRGLYEEKIRRHRISKLRKQAEELGLEVIEIKKAA